MSRPLRLAFLGCGFITAVHSRHLRALGGDKRAKARKVGELVAQRAKDAGVQSVVFDRGGNRYHGRVAAIADGAREAGLEL